MKHWLKAKTRRPLVKAVLIVLGFNIFLFLISLAYGGSPGRFAIIYLVQTLAFITVIGVALFIFKKIKYIKSKRLSIALTIILAIILLPIVLLTQPLIAAVVDERISRNIDVPVSSPVAIELTQTVNLYLKSLQKGDIDKAYSLRSTQVNLISKPKLATFTQQVQPILKSFDQTNVTSITKNYESAKVEIRPGRGRPDTRSTIFCYDYFGTATFTSGEKGKVYAALRPGINNNFVIVDAGVFPENSSIKQVPCYKY
jgi:hypothetical protein